MRLRSRHRYRHRRRHRLRCTASRWCWPTRVGTVAISTKHVRDRPVLPNVAGRATAGRFDRRATYLRQWPIT